jgi:hypothetical protein
VPIDRESGRGRVISPELVLVDEELAAWSRLRLREEAAAAEARRSAPQAPPATPSSLLELGRRLADSEQPSPTKQRRRWSVLALLAVLAVAAAIGVWILMRSPHPSATKNVSQTPSTVVLAWPQVRGARSYSVTLLRNSQTIFRAEGVAGVRFSLPQAWLYQGRSYTLDPGPYRWEVRASLSGKKVKKVLAGRLVVKP